MAFAIGLLPVIAAGAAAAPVTSFTISSNRPVEQIDGTSKSYDPSSGVFTTSAQPVATDQDGHTRRQIAGAVQSLAMDRTFVVRARLPLDEAPVVGRTYPIDGSFERAGLVLWLRNVDCPVTSGSYTLGEYAEAPDGTPTTIDISFTGTCEAADRMPATFTGRYRLNATAAAAPPPAAAPKDTTRPVLSAVKLRRSVFPRSRGTTVAFRLSEAARTTFAVARRTSGRRVGRRCVRVRASNRRRPACSRYTTVRGTRSVLSRAGHNTVRLPTRFGRRALGPGRYRLALSAKDAAGNRSRTAHARFRIARR